MRHLRPKFIRLPVDQPNAATVRSNQTPRHIGIQLQIRPSLAGVSNPGSIVEDDARDVIALHGLNIVARSGVEIHSPLQSKD